MGNINISYSDFEEKNQINDILNKIYDFIWENRKTEESKLYKQILVDKINELNNNDKSKIKDYIYQQSQRETSRDNKLQLLELYATIENNSKIETNEYQNLDFDVIWWTIDWKYKIEESQIRNLWNWKYLIKIESIKRQNKFINYRRNSKIEIKYNPRNWVIRYNDWYWNYRIASIDHKYETRFNINRNNLWPYENINWTIYKKWTIVPLKLRVRWQNIKLILKF